MVRLGLAELEAEQPARQNPSRAASAFSQGASRQKGRASDKSVQVSDEEVDALIEREMLREIIKAEIAKPKNARRSQYRRY